MNSVFDKIPYDRINEVPGWQRWAAVAGVVAVIFGAYFYFFHAEGRKKIASLKREVATLENNLAKTRPLVKKLPGLQKKIELLKKDLDRARQELPGEREIPFFLKSISEEGKKAGLEFLLFQPEKEEVRDFYARVPVKIEVLGKFHHVMTFFDRVRRLPRIVDIEKINMKVQKKRNAFLLKTTCYATTYKYIEGAEKKIKTK